jgi:hypothetical protein
MRRLIALLGAAAGLLAVAVTVPSPAHAATHTFRTEISGANEVPAAGSAHAVVSITIDDATNTVCAYLTLDSSLLVGDITAMHIHQGATGVNGSVVIGFTPGTTACTPSVDAGLVAGIEADPAGFYFNAHTAANAAGAARGQLAMVTPSATPTALTGGLSGANEVPATSSAATGAVAVTVDTATDLVCVALTLSGLTVPDVQQMHIHQAAAGANGPVVIGFTPGATACAVGSDSVVSALASSPAGFYFNVHTAANPGGEIRGQLAAAVTTTVPPPTSTTTTPAAAAPVAVRATPRFTG